MYALLAHRRVLTPIGRTGLAPKAETTIEFRSMGCFNGLNQTNAFASKEPAFQGDTTFLSAIDGSGVNHGAGIYGSFNAVEMGLLTNIRLQYEAGPWEVIALGWVQDGYGGLAEVSIPAGFNLPNPTMGANQENCPLIGNMLLSEGFQDFYYDGFDGGQRRTRRVLTPNEQFMSNLLKWSMREDFYGFPNRAAYGRPPEHKGQDSRFMMALHRNRIQNSGCAFQFVGSERPSGQAVSYLQAWRNTARLNVGGWTGPNRAKYNTITQVIRPRMSASASWIAILDMFTNHGSDSCISAMAGQAYIAYATKHGFWNTKNLYRCQGSMIREGRYNKGGQADAIAAALSQKLSRIRHPAISHDLADHWDTMMRVISLENNLRSWLDPANLQSLRRDPVRYLEGFSNAARQYSVVDPHTSIQRWLAIANAIPDLAAPVTPTAASDGAGLGFVQWTSQAAETVH